MAQSTGIKSGEATGEDLWQAPNKVLKNARRSGSLLRRGCIAMVCVVFFVTGIESRSPTKNDAIEPTSKLEVVTKMAFSLPAPTVVPVPANDEVSDAFNFCTAASMGNPDDEEFRSDVWYQCRGSVYDDFGVQLSAYASKKSEERPPLWGHRAAAIPANMTLLFFGNSHTRQLASALACQMGPEQVEEVYHFHFGQPAANMAVRYRFRNGASLYVVVDSYAVYSPRWQELLEQQIDKKLDDFDAIVLGHFASAVPESTFKTNMVQMLDKLPEEYDADFQKHTPPGVIAVTDAYDKPFMFAANFAKSHMQASKTACYTIVDIMEDGRTNVKCLQTREYIEDMGHEGASANRLKAKDCKNVDVFHRCMGAAGGHPDLKAWDVTEFLYQQWPATAASYVDYIPDPLSNSAPSPALESSTDAPTRAPTTQHPTPVSVPDDNDLLDELNYCVPHFMGDPQDEERRDDVWYNCEGPAYDEFVGLLHDFATDKAASGNKPENWGRRASLIPANKKILLFGNSHTRQLGQSMACQMGEGQVIDVLHHEYDAVDPNMAIRYRFRNGSTMYIVSNSYVPYSLRWQALLEMQIGVELKDFDAIVLGHFNTGGPDSNFKKGKLSRRTFRAFA
jgi:hypothetical protein